MWDTSVSRSKYRITHINGTLDDVGFPGRAQCTFIVRQTRSAHRNSDVRRIVKLILSPLLLLAFLIKSKIQIK